MDGVLKGGIAKLKYTVNDMNGNEQSKSRTVLYNHSDRAAKGDDYIISANDFGEYNYNYDANEERLITKSNVEVFDKFNGEKLAKSVSVDVTEYVEEIGISKVEFSVDEDPTTKVVIEVDRYAAQDSRLSIESFTEINVGESLDLKEGLLALDKEGNSLVADVKVTPSTIDTSKHGIYNV